MFVSSFSEVNTVLKRYMPLPGTVREAYTLDRIIKIMSLLGNPQEKFKTVHIAGTSGKTSTSYYAAALLQESGKKVGLTVSPHIDEVNERLQINLVPLNESTYCDYFNRFMFIVEPASLKPTYFELLIAYAYWVFAQEKVDYAVVEVGLGGLLDGTNVIERPDKICVITDIGLDHTEILGHTTEEIAAQKAGIIHRGNAVFTYNQSNEVMQVIRDVCGQKHAELHKINPLAMKDLPQDLPLFQQRNWYLARSVHEFVCERDKLAALTEKQLHVSTKTYIPGRMEVILRGSKAIVLDGAHNDQKLEVLCRSIRHAFPGQPVAVLLALKLSEDFRKRTDLKSIVGIANHIVITSFESAQDTVHQSVEPLDIAGYIAEIGFESCEVVDDPKAAFKKLLDRQEQVLLVTGSFYLLNHVRPMILQPKDTK